MPATLPPLDVPAFVMEYWARRKLEARDKDLT